MIRKDKIGEGTYGIVYSCSSPTSGRGFAVKRNLSDHNNSFIGVIRELDILNKTRNHPNIVKLEQVSFGEPFAKGVFSPLNKKSRSSQKDDSMHFVFPQASYDFHHFIYKVNKIDSYKRYITHLLLAVEYMHSIKIIHRDLKPCNVLIFNDEKDISGEVGVAKICDFGLSKPFTTQGDQTPGVVSSWYRAPEVALGNPHYDYKIDIWSLGCIFFEMISKSPFIASGDKDNDVISHILGALPEELSSQKFRELIRGNKWKKVTLNSHYAPKTRKSFERRFKMTSLEKEEFKNKVGDIESFCDLLKNMIQFVWDKRFTATECLSHPFFSEQKTLIEETRKLLVKIPEEHIYSPKCVEHRWMSKMAISIFNTRGKLNWYSNRILFQAMDLFDRYLTAVLSSAKFSESSIESEFKGLVHDKFGAELRFMVCCYLCVKYFSSLHHSIPFENIVSEEFRTKEALVVAEQFEGGLIKNCLCYDIYRPTLYETADLFDDKLDESDVRDLIVLYSMNPSIDRMVPSELYKYYKQNLKGKDIQLLMKPICKISHI